MNQERSIEKINQIIKPNMLNVVFGLVSTASFVAICIMESRKEYIGIAALPVFYMLALMLWSARKRFYGIGTLIIHCMYFLRYTIFPVCIISGEYFCDFSLREYVPYFNKACVLMCVEVVAVYIVLLLTTKRQPRAQPIVKTCSKNSIWKKVISAVVAVLMIYNILLYIMYPSLLSAYWGILFIRPTTAATGGLLNDMGGVLYYPYKLSTEFLKIAIIALLASYNKKKKNWSEIKKILAMCPVLLVALFLGSAEQINSLILTVGVGYYMLTKSNRYTVHIIVVAVITATIGAFLFFTKIADVTDKKSLARIIDNYFCGPMNIAATIGMKDLVPLGGEGFFNDLLSSIPILQKFATPSVNEMFSSIYSLQGAILPLTGYGYLYFGTVFSFVPAVAVAVFVSLLDFYIDCTPDEFRMICFYIVIHFALGIGMYTVTIYYSLVVYELMIPAIIIVFVKLANKQKRLKKEI